MTQPKVLLIRLMRPSGALQNRIVLPAKGSRKLAFFLGVSEDAITNMKQCKSRQKKILTAIRQDYAEQA